jgi:hypothetical protein
MPRVLPAALAMLLALAPALAGRVDGGPAGVVGLDGRPLDPLAPAAGVAATVLVFTMTDCPISNRYAPELRRLHAAFSGRGVRFWLVYPKREDDAPAIRAHGATFAQGIAAVRDPQLTLVRATGVSVTPEVAVFDAAGVVRYRGRIDDRYVEFGVDRPAPTRHDLADALTHVLAGTPVPEPVTRAIGCFLADLRP